MAPTIWKELNFPKCTIQIISLEKERFSEAASIMHTAFFPFENICLGCDMTSNEIACEELALLAATIAQDNMSLIAIVKETNEIIGVCFNKLQKLPEPNEPSFFEKFRDENCKEDNSISLMNFMIDLDSCIDTFKLFDVQCLLEITFLGVVPEWGCKQLGFHLVDSTLTLIKSLSHNKNTDKLIPKHAVTLATSTFSYKIIKQLGFRDVYKKEFSDYEYNGKWKYSDKVDCNLHNQGLVLAAIEL